MAVVVLERDPTNNNVGAESCSRENWQAVVNVVWRAAHVFGKLVKLAGLNVWYPVHIVDSKAVDPAKQSGTECIACSSNRRCVPGCEREDKQRSMFQVALNSISQLARLPSPATGRLRTQAIKRIDVVLESSFEVTGATLVTVSHFAVVDPREPSNV